MQFSPLNDEQMSNKVGVEHQPVKVYVCICVQDVIFEDVVC